MNITTKLSLLVSLLATTLTANTQENQSINIYGVGEKVSEKSYNGVGFQYENDISNIVLEKGSDYSKTSGVLKLDINNYFYSKFGIGFLKREILINGNETDITQKTGGIALGFGDSKNYNIEIGHIKNKLSGASSADGDTKTSYIEALAIYQDFDTVGVYKNTNVYNKDYSDYSLDIGYYPIKDLRISAKHNSIEHNDNDYTAKLGVKYTFKTNKWSPFIRANKNTSKNTLVAMEWSNEIQNKSLNMRDEFESAIGTNTIVAQTVAPTIFANKIAIINNTGVHTPPSTPTNAAPTWTANSYNTGLTITDANDDVKIIKDLTAISSDAEGDAITYSIVSISVPDTDDQARWNNSVYIDNGTLKIHNLTTNNPTHDGTVTIIVKATATGGSNNATIDFTFTDVQ